VGQVVVERLAHGSGKRKAVYGRRYRGVGIVGSGLAPPIASGFSVRSAESHGQRFAALASRWLAPTRKRQADGPLPGVPRRQRPETNAPPGNSP